MKFNYQARTKESEIRQGSVEATSKEAAANLLQKQGFYITYLESEDLKPVYAKEIKIFDRISRKDIVMFSRQLAILFKSGVPLLDSLRAITRQTKSASFREKLIKMTEEIEGGASFSKALSMHPNIFSPLYINMSRAGEVSGKLSETLSFMADHLEREYYLNAKIKGAMLYPVLVLFVIAVVGVLMIFYIIPPLTALLRESGQEIPFMTKIVLAGGNFIKDYFVFILVFLILGLYFVYKFRQTAEGQALFDRISLKIPLFGNFLRMVYLARFSENLSTLISGGIPIAQALDITAKTVENIVYKDIILETEEGVKKGEQISSILNRHQEVIPPLFIQMVFIGEKTGGLDRSLTNLNNFYMREVETITNNFMAILEPALIVVLGGVVGFFVVSVLLPIYNISGI